MRRLAPFLLVLAAAGCGGGGDPVIDWMAALNDRNWDRACELTLKPPDDCAAGTRRLFEPSLPIEPDPNNTPDRGRTPFVLDYRGSTVAGSGWVQARAGRVVYEVFTIR
jgi:hypothetical protein